jgi:hypothetical protein
MKEAVTVQRGVISPIACYQEGWELIKDEYWVVFAVSAIGMLLGSLVPMGILLGPMMCGIYLVLLRRMRGQPILVDHLFKGFEWFGPGLVAFLITLVAMMILMVPAGIVIAIAAAIGAQIGGEEAAVVLALLAGMFSLFLMMGAGVLFTFAYPLIVDRELEPVEAIKVSIQGGMANLLGMVGLLCLNVLLSLVGTCFFFVGSYLVMPVSFAALAVAYRKIYGLAPVPGYQKLGLDPLTPAV